MTNGYRVVLLFTLIFSICSPFSFAQGTKGNSTLSNDSVSPDLALTIPPTVITGPVSNITSSDAQLSAHINPNGQLTTYKFLYGLTPSYTDSTNQMILGDGTNINTVFENIYFLSPRTNYHFTIAATNGDGTTFGNDMQFITLPNPPDITTLKIVSTGLNYSAIQFNVNPFGDSTVVWITWGELDTLSNVTDSIYTGSFEGEQTFRNDFDNLKPNTTYSYRIHAKNKGGEYATYVARFTTLSSDHEYYSDSYTAALFHLNDQLEFIQDYSGNENHGYSSIPPDGSAKGKIRSITNSKPEITDGVFGSARTFNTTDQFIQIDQAASIQFVSDDFTLEAWINTNELPDGTEGIILSHGSLLDSSESFILKVSDTKRLTLSLSEDGESEYTVSTENPLPKDSRWHHVAAVVEWYTEQVTFFIDGIEQPSTSIGTFPTQLYISSAPLRIGLLSYMETGGSTSLYQPNPPTFGVDELRISDISRSKHEFSIPGSIFGLTFWDRNNNHIFDLDSPATLLSTLYDTTLANWQIIAQRLGEIEGVPSPYLPETTYSNSLGYYSFSNLKDGKYLVKQTPQEDWMLTFPDGEGTHTALIEYGKSIYNVNFGFTQGHKFTGPPGGNWSDPANWEDGTVPNDTTPVYLNTVVVFDVIEDDSIQSLRLDAGATLIFDSTAGKLYVLDRLEINENSSLSFPGEQNEGELYCDGDFINKGTFEPGNSTVYITGDNSTIIMNELSSSSAGIQKAKTTSRAFSTNHFYNLSISGMNDSTAGNLVIDNVIELIEDLNLRSNDTLFIENGADHAISESGLLPGGTIRRKIIAGQGAYRFESPETFVQFDGASELPTYLTVTTEAGTFPDTSSGLKWKLVNSTVDTLTNTLSATGINHFSKWVAGKPGSGVNLRTSVTDEDSIVRPRVARSYIIKPSEGVNMNATLQIRFDETELESEDITESGLQLGRGAYFTDTVSSRWNMVSLPVIPDHSHIDSTFPTAMSAAYSFSNGYVSTSDLTFGTGYWLRFPGLTTVEILGNDQKSYFVPVQAGWNMIGAISYPVDPATVTLYPEGGGAVEFTSFSFFGYNNGYQIADVLKPLHAYWVKVDNAGTLALEGGTGMLKHSSSNLMNSVNSLTLQDGSGNKQALFFTFGNSIDPMKYELPPAAPSGILDVRFTTGVMVEALSNKATKIVQIDISSASFPCTLTWDVKEKSGTGTLLIDGNEVIMQGSGSVVLTNPNATVSLAMNATPSSETPKQFALYQNYPNPFNPTTSISFELATDVNVTLKIYNILGQEVFTAINNRMMNAGYHTYSLNTSSWASGVYFYKISAGSFTDIKKMVLTR